MKNAKFLTVMAILIVACATQPQPELFIKKVDIKVIQADSLYSMVIINKVDSLSFDDVANNFMTLIESQKDTLILKDLIGSFKDFAGKEYSVYRYDKINKQIEGNWFINGTDLVDTINLNSSNYNFKFPNLLAVNYNDTWIYFSLNNNIGTGTYLDNVVKLTR